MSMSSKVQVGSVKVESMLTTNHSETVVRERTLEPHEGVPSNHSETVVRG